MLHRLSSRFGLWLCVWLPACSSYAPPDSVTGMSRDQVLARMGQAERERRLDGASRLEFPRGPYGKHTWFVYFDASGRASRAEQVLSEENFRRIEPGMTQEEVLQRLGRPGTTQGLARARGVVWSYRYENSMCQWFQVELSLQQQVRSAGYGQPPECAGPNDRADK